MGVVSLGRVLSEQSRRRLDGSVAAWMSRSPVRLPLSLRNVEDLLFERGVDICHETVRLWWNRFSAPYPTRVR